MKTIIKVVIYSLSVVLFILAFVILIPRYDKMKKKQEELSEYENILAEKRKTLQKLREVHTGLISNPDIIEKAAREKYHYCKEGEIVYRYTPDEIKKFLQKSTNH